MRLTPALVRRSRNCKVCQAVAAVEDVNVRLFDESGTVLPPKEAIEYVRSIGMSGSYAVLLRRITAHRKHVARDLADPPRAIAPPGPGGEVVPVAPVGGPPGWVRVNEQGVEVGMDALRLIAARLDEMEDKELISVARLGQAAAAKRGDWEAKGRSLAQVDSVLQIAAGLASAHRPASEGEAPE